MKKRKILFITPKQFGYSIPHFFWCKYLKDEFEIYYICFKNYNDEIKLDNINIKYFSFSPNKFFRVIQYYYYAISELKNNKTDYVFVVQYKLDFLLKIFFPFRKLYYDIRTGGVSNLKKSRIVHDLQLTISSLLFNHTTILSEGLRMKLKVPLHKSSIVPLGAEIISITDKCFKTLHLLYIGVLSGRHIEKTIEGFAKFQKEYPETTYTIIGYGHNDDEYNINQKIKYFNLEENIIYLGRLHHSDAKIYFDKCNVGVSFIPITPFYDHQPPTKNFEYLMSGMVCIATATTSNREMINSQNGVLINDTPNDFYLGLKYILELKESFNSRIIRKSVENNLWENIVKSHIIPILNV